MEAFKENSDKHCKPLRVLLVSPIPPPVGGIATWTKILLSEMKKRPSIELKHVDTALRWKIQGIHSTWRRLSGGLVQAAWDIFHVVMGLIRYRPHVLHLTTSGAYGSLKDCILLVFARLFGVPGLIHYHTSILASHGVESWQFRIARLVMTLSACIVVLDPKTFGLLQNYVPTHKLHKVPNMIDLKLVDQLREDVQQKTPTELSTTVRCIFVGRVIQNKGVVEQVAACSKLPELELHLVGPIEGFFRKQLQEIAKCREGGEWLKIHGQLDSNEARRKIFQSDIVLLPSYFEAFPNVVLESMAFAKPVVASDVGAISEMIDAQGKNPCGVCVAPKDTRSLQSALEKLLGERQKWEEMGQHGRKRVETFYGPKAVIAQLEELWIRMRKSQSCAGGGKLWLFSRICG